MCLSSDMAIVVILVMIPYAVAASAVKLNANQMANRELAHGEFDPCRGMRILTKTETGRAKVYGTRVFNKCGFSLMDNFANGMTIPDFYITTLAGIVCKGVLFAYSNFAAKVNLLVISSKITVGDLMRQIERLLSARKRAKPITKYCNPQNASDIYYSDANILYRLVMYVSRCILQAEDKVSVDGNIVLQVIQYYRFLMF